MRLFKKSKQQSSGRRQRLQPEQAAPPRPYAYRAQRTEEAGNTGRQLQREALKPVAKKVGRFWLQRFGQLILLVVLVICTINVLSLSSDPRVVILPSAGQTYFLHSSSVYEQAASKLFANSIWNHNKITVDTGQINRQLGTEFPELIQTSITLPLLAHRPIIYIQPAAPALIYHINNQNYVLDAQGKALFVLPSVSSSSALTSLTTVTDQDTRSIKLNQLVLTQSDVSFINTVMGELAARHVSASSLVLPANSRELDVYISGQPYYVKFNLENNDPRQQAGTFLAVQAYLESQHITPAHYIDVRVDSRAYYQ